MNDLMAWNADATRMPYRMHSESLRRLFIENELAEGQCRVEGRPIALTDLRVPMFAVAARTDHVAPWPSLYKIYLLTDARLRLVLVSGATQGSSANLVILDARIRSPIGRRVAARRRIGRYSC